MLHLIRRYKLEQGALEVQYIEECFAEFEKKKKTADEIIQRLSNREHLILISMAPSDDGEGYYPVAFKVGHELRAQESDAKLVELVDQLADCIDFSSGKVFYSWIGATREPWRGQGHYRALTEQQEEWAHLHGYQMLVVKTKNKFYPMRAALDHLRFDILRFQPDAHDNGESKVFLGKKIGSHLLRDHLTTRTVTEPV
jgi:GNAT superfamily N-acetyltransferase